MKSNDKFTLKGLLKEKKVTIPAIQRDYAFGRTNQETAKKRKNFISKLAAVIKGDQEKKLHLDFVYGKNEGESFILLDGQQRITTLWLLSVYLSKKNNNKDDLLNNFTYATRTSTREFCKAIIEEEWKPESVSVKYFQDQKWFFNSWRFDPTIGGMLVVLDEIHNHLPEGGDYSNIDNITFSFLDSEELGQPEELYVKMNSRGKQLSDWDNFKSELFELESSNNYKEWIDKDFLNYFWKIDTNGEDKVKNTEDKAKNTEKRMLRFFYLNLFMIRTLSPDSKESNMADIIEYIERKEDKEDKYNWEKMIDENFFKSIKHFIELLESKREEIKSYDSPRFSSIRFDDLINILKKDSLNGFVGDLDLYFSYWKYLNTVDDKTFNIEELFNIIRISTNMEESYRKELEITRVSLKSFKTAIEWKDGILDYFANQDLSAVSFGAYSEEQKNEEIIKARLLLNEPDLNRKKILYKAENNDLFKGTIGWILRLSDDNNIEKFEDYSKWFFNKFDDKGLRDKKKIAEMLKYADVRLGRFFPKNNNGGINNFEQYWSWKRYFREYGYKDEKNKKNERNIDWMKKWRSGENVEVKSLEKWRQWLIYYPDILEEIGAIDDNELIGIRWEVIRFSSKKYSIPIIAATKYIGEKRFKYWGYQGDADKNRAIFTEKNLEISFDNGKEEFVIRKIDDENELKRISAENIEGVIEELKEQLKEL